MDASNKSVAKGVTFVDLLALLFIAFKLAHIISWPWIWVLAPFWIPLLGILALFGGYLGYLGGREVYWRTQEWWRKRK